MKVIKKAKHEAEVYQAYRFKCPVCNSELEGTKKEMEQVILLGKLHYGFICPVCGGAVAVKESDLSTVR